MLTAFALGHVSRKVFSLYLIFITDKYKGSLCMIQVKPLYFTNNFKAFMKKTGL